MKRTMITGAALAALMLAAPAWAQTSYNAATEGSTSANFRYGYDVGGGWTTFTGAAQTSGCPIATPSCFVGPASFLGVYFDGNGNYNGAILNPGEVTFHPGPNGELIGVEFVAPTAGTYSFVGAFRAADAPNGNGVVYTTPIGSSTLGVRPATAPFSFIQTLAANQAARFTVSYNGAYAYDTTGFSLNVTAVPEPASWALMIGGFGLAGMAMRRRQPAMRVATAA